MANRVDPDQMPHSGVPVLSLHCLLRPVCPKCQGKIYHIWTSRYWQSTFLPWLCEVQRGLVKEENIGIKHGFSCINIRQVPWEVLKTEAEGHGFQHLPRDLSNVNALKNHVRSLLLHKNWKHLLHFVLFLALFCFAFSQMSRKRNFHELCSF